MWMWKERAGGKRKIEGSEGEQRVATNLLGTQNDEEPQMDVAQKEIKKEMNRFRNRHRKRNGQTIEQTKKSSHDIMKKKNIRLHLYSHDQNTTQI